MPKLGMKPIRRKQIIEATLKCIAEHGLNNFTQEMVAKKAGVSKGIVTYYFKTKHQLLIESYQYFLESYFYNIEPHITKAGKAIDAMEIIVSNTLGIPNKIVQTNKPVLLSLEPGEIKKLIVQMYSRLTTSEEFRAVVGKAYQAYYQGIKDLIDIGIEEGEFNTKTPHKAACEIMFFLEGKLIYDIIDFQLPVSDQLEFCMIFIRKTLLAC